MQHLNLYKQLEKPKQLPFAASQQLWILGAAFALMLGIYAWLVISYGAIDDELANLKQRQQVVDGQLAVLNAEKERLLKDNTLEQEIETLKRDVVFRRKLLANVDPSTSKVVGGFSEHLQGLARQHIEGMWLNEIELDEGGQQLALVGQTRSPELVPRYIQRLSDEAAFEGHQFRIFRIHNTDSQGGLLSFELRSREVGEKSSAEVAQSTSAGIR